MAASGRAPLLTQGDFSCPQVGLGCSMLFDNLGKEREVELFKKAIDCGYRHFDTSPFYGTEDSIGTAVSEKIMEGVIKREDVFITSKLPEWAHRPENARKAVERSLSYLKMDYIDMYLIHNPWSYEPTFELEPPDDNTSGEMYRKSGCEDLFTLDDTDHLETWRALESFVEEGIVKHIGLSNFNSRQIKRITDNCKFRPVNIQIEIHPYFSNRRLVDFCQDLGITVTAYIPLFHSLFMTPEDQTKNVIPPLEREDIKDIARKHGKTPGQVLLRFQLQRNIIIIPRTTKYDRLVENMSVFDFNLDEDDIKTIFDMDINLRVRKVKIMMKHKEYPYNEPF